MINNSKIQYINYPALVFFFLLSMVILSFNKFNEEFNKNISYQIKNSISFIQVLVTKNIPDFVFHYQNTLNTIQTLEQANNSLKEQLINMQENNLLLKQLQFKNQEFQELLNIITDKKVHVLTTSQINNPNFLNNPSINQILMIPLGANHNIPTNALVISDKGIIGYITEVYDTSSEVMTIKNPDFKIAAITSHSKQDVIIIGNKNGIANLIFYVEEHKLKNGETIFTSGIEGKFPNGIPIGTIELNEQSNTWEVNLFEPLSSLSYVAIVE